MARDLQPCGTRAAYKRHLYQGPQRHREVPCDACRAASTGKAKTYAAARALRHTSPTGLYPVIHALACLLLDPGGPDVPFSAPREWLHECVEGP